MRNKHFVKYPELEAEMAKRGHSQKDLSKIVGLNEGSISRRLSGEKEWKLSEILKVCEAYGKSFYELFK